jgi:hypothetical protein
MVMASCAFWKGQRAFHHVLEHPQEHGAAQEHGTQDQVYSNLASGKFTQRR